MGDLVLLTRPAAPARSIVEGGSAAILFFTGVRYYRSEESAMPAASVGPKRRRSTKPRKSRRAVLVELHG